MIHAQTPDDATLMAYADGELDPIAARRVEQAIAADPALAATVEGFRASRARVSAAFAPVIGEPVPDHLSAMVDTKVVPLRPPVARRWNGWQAATALAACLVVALLVTRPAAGPVAVEDGRLVASGSLERALDTQLAAGAGETRVRLSFRGKDGGYCRVFDSPALAGIACHERNHWLLPRTDAPAAAAAASADYRQAGSGDAALMAAAQEMMAGDALDPAGEAAARARGWN